MAIAPCGPLQDYSSGKYWWQRWGPAFAGPHILLGYETTSWDTSGEGWRFAEYQMRTPSWWNWWSNPMKVRDAWAQMAIDAQGDSSVRYAMMGAYDYWGTSNYDDYFWGKGTTGPDIYSAWGYWKVSGPA